LDPVPDLVVHEEEARFIAHDMLALQKIRNGEVAYMLENGVVVGIEVLVAGPLDLETDDEEEDFSLSFLVYNILHCLIWREHHPYGHNNVSLCVSFS
jgi:hypothetical protein